MTVSYVVVVETMKNFLVRTSTKKGGTKERRSRPNEIFSYRVRRRSREGNTLYRLVTDSVRPRSWSGPRTLPRRKIGSEVYSLLFFSTLPPSKNRRRRSDRGSHTQQTSNTSVVLPRRTFSNLIPVSNPS